jgi:hypothetical protein
MNRRRAFLQTSLLATCLAGQGHALFADDPPTTQVGVKRFLYTGKIPRSLVSHHSRWQTILLHRFEPFRSCHAPLPREYQTVARKVRRQHAALDSGIGGPPFARLGFNTVGWVQEVTVRNWRHSLNQNFNGSWPALRYQAVQSSFLLPRTAAAARKTVPAVTDAIEVRFE